MDYTRQINSAKRMIAKYGQTVVYYRKTINPNLAKPWKATDLTLPVEIKMVFTQPNNDGVNFINYTKTPEMSKEGIEYGYMISPGFDVKVNDEIIRDGEVMVIKSVRNIKPADKTIVFILEFFR